MTLRSNVTFFACLLLMQWTAAARWIPQMLPEEEDPTLEGIAVEVVGESTTFYGLG
jgi:hypothetical protein